ncbi:MAG TPA: glycosyltransferase family 2 protein [Nitrolancea sp.]
MSKVAVIIPTHNRADLIAETIESALAQTYPDIEIIVVDDGSTDNTKDVVASFGDRVRYLWQPSSGRPAAPRNLGARSTSAEFLTFVDSDDLLLPDKTEVQMRYLEAHPECDLVFGDCAYMEFDGRDIPGSTTFAEKQWNGEASLQQLIRRNVITVVAPLVRRAAFERVGGFCTSVHHEDYDLWLRIAATGTIAGTNDMVAKVRLGPMRRSTDRVATVRGNVEVFERFQTLFPELMSRHGEAVRRRLTIAYLYLGIAFHDEGQRLAAFKALRAALRYDRSNRAAYVRLILLLLSDRQILSLKRKRERIRSARPQLSWR